MQSVIRLFTYFIFLLLLSQCGIPGQSNVACLANFSGQQMSVYVTRYSGANQYQVTICEVNRSSSKTFSVYGAFDQNEIATMNLPARVRLGHIEGSLKAGSKFYVTFNNDDSWFVINEDDVNGNYSRANELVSGKIPF